MAEEVGVHWAVTSSAAETYRRDMEAAKRLQASTDRLAKVIDGGSEASKRQARAVLTAAESLQRERKVTEAAVKITKEWGLSKQVASQVARKFKGNVDALSAEVRREAIALDRAQKETRELARAQREAGGLTGAVTKTIKASAAAIAGFAVAAIGAQKVLDTIARVARYGYEAFGELEAAIVSLRKVVNDLGDASLGRLVDSLEDLSTSSVPIATERLIELGATAAQIGIQSAEGIRLAAETGAQLAEATDLSGESAIKSLSRILAIQGEGVSSLDNLGSALVELGNTSRATEAEIEPVANEIARATANYDIGSPTILGYAAALAEMGAKAEGSGTALASLFQALLVATKTGENLDELARIAGISADELKRLTNEDTGQAAIVFLQGLGRYGKEGIIALDEVGLSSKRVAKALLPLAANSDRLVDRIALSNKAFQENTALSREAEAAFGKLKSDAQRLENALRLVASDGFGALAPAISTFLKEAVASIVAWRRFKKELEGIPAVAVPAAVAIELLNKRIERDMALLRSLPLLLSGLATTGLEPLADALEIMAAAPGGFGLQVLADQVRGLQVALLKAGAAAVIPKDNLEETGGVADEVAEILKALGIELDDDTASLTKMAGALESVYNELKTLDAAKRFVKDFGLSLSEAGDAAKLKLAEGVKLADDEVAALVKRLAASKKELEALAAIANVAPGKLEKREVTPDTELQEPDEERFASFKRIAELASQYATEEERAAAAIKEAQELLGGGAEYADLLKRITEENRVQVEVTTEELEKQEDLWEKIRNAAFDAAKDANGAWQDFFLWISDNVDGILNAIGMIGDVLTEAGETEAGALLSGFEQIASGNVGAGIATIAGGFGLSEGNFLAEGAAIGQELGGTWGAVIGATLGAFVKKGKDDLHSALRDVEGRADLVVSQAEGELAEAAQQAEAVLEGFFNSLQEGLVAELDFAAASLEFHGRGGDRWRVVVNGIEQIFDTMEEALVFATQGVLAANAQTAGLGDNMRALFENLAGPAVVGSLEKLQAAIAYAQQLDFEETGVTGEYIKARERGLSIGRQYGLNLESIIALEDRRIAQQRRALDAQAANVYGVEDVVGRFEDLTGNLTRFDAELAADHDSRVARLESLRSQLGATADDTAAAAADVEAGFRGLRDGGLRAQEGTRILGEEILTTGERFAEGARGIAAAREATRGLEEEIAALEASLEGGAEAFGADRVGQLWTTAVDQVATSLIQMIDAVQGGTLHATELEDIRQRQFAFTLAAQIQQAQILLVTMEGVSDAVRGLLEGLIVEAQGLLEGLASGEVRVSTGGLRQGVGGGGGAASRREQAARQAEEEARRAAEEQERMLDTLRDLADEWTAAGQALRDTDMGAALRDLRQRAADAIAEANAAAAADPDVAAALRDTIAATLADQIRQVGQDALSALGNPFRDLRQSFRDNAREIRYMLANLKELGVTAEQVANSVKQGSFGTFLDILEAQAQRVGNEEALAMIQERRGRWELALEELKFELLVKEWQIAGSINDEIQALIDLGREMFDTATAISTATRGMAEAASEFAGWTVQAGRGSGGGVTGGAGAGGARTETFEEFLRRLLGDTGTELERLERQFVDIFATIRDSAFSAQQKAEGLAAAEAELAQRRIELQDRQLAGLYELAGRVEGDLLASKSPKAQLEALKADFARASASLSLGDEGSIQAFEEAARRYIDYATGAYAEASGSAQLGMSANEAVQAALAARGITAGGLTGTLPPTAPGIGSFSPGPASFLPPVQTPIIVPQAPGVDFSGLERRVDGLTREVVLLRQESARSADRLAPALQGIDATTNRLFREGLL